MTFRQYAVTPSVDFYSEKHSTVSRVIVEGFADFDEVVLDDYRNYV